VAEKKEKCSLWALGMARAYPKELLKKSKIWEYVKCAYPEEEEKEEAKEKIKEEELVKEAEEEVEA